MIPPAGTLPLDVTLDAGTGLPRLGGDDVGLVVRTDGRLEVESHLAVAGGSDRSAAANEKARAELEECARRIRDSVAASDARQAELALVARQTEASKDHAAARRRINDGQVAIGMAVAEGRDRRPIHLAVDDARADMKEAGERVKAITLELVTARAAVAALASKLWSDYVAARRTELAAARRVMADTVTAHLADLGGELLDLVAAERGLQATPANLVPDLNQTAEMPPPPIVDPAALTSDPIPPGANDAPG